MHFDQVYEHQLVVLLLLFFTSIYVFEISWLLGFIAPFVEKIAPFSYICFRSPLLSSQNYFFWYENGIVEWTTDLYLWVIRSYLRLGISRVFWLLLGKLCNFELYLSASIYYKKRCPIWKKSSSLILMLRF